MIFYIFAMIPIQSHSTTTYGNALFCCRAEIDECASYPCMNGATCSDHLNKFSCRCKTGFEGSTCDIGRSAGRNGFDIRNCYFLVELAVKNSDTFVQDTEGAIK